MVLYTIIYHINIHIHIHIHIHIYILYIYREMSSPGNVKFSDR